MPILESELIDLNAVCASKAHAIQHGVRLLQARGRVNDAARLEQALWRRETAASTGFGGGFAIPHCRSQDVSVNSLVVLKLRQPVDWGSIDGEPVRMVVLMVVRESARDLEARQILSQLARAIMDESFRQQFLKETDRDALCVLLGRAIDLRSAAGNGAVPNEPALPAGK